MWRRIILRLRFIIRVPMIHKKSEVKYCINSVCSSASQRFRTEYYITDKTVRSSKYCGVNHLIWKPTQSLWLKSCSVVGNTDPKIARDPGQLAVCNYAEKDLILPVPMALRWLCGEILYQ